MSSGIPFWTALGQKLRLNIESYLRKLLADNYEEVRTPFIMNNKLWQLTGHAEKYDENMFHTEIWVFKVKLVDNKPRFQKDLKFLPQLGIMI